MSASPLATVVIVNFNYEKYIAAAIDSALNQSYAAIEVIVVDDGSTDGSRRVISSFEPRVQSIFLAKNSGQGSAYNAGWAAARGEVVLFLDSDDVLMPDAMQKVVDAFERSGASKVQFYLQQVDRELNPLGYLLPSYGFSDIAVREQISNYGYYVSPPTSGNAYSKKFLDEIMPIVDVELYRRAADGYTTGLAGITGRVASLPETLGLYRIHGTNGGGEAGVQSVKHLHHMFMRDIKREDSQHSFGDHFDFHFLPDRSRFCPGHTKLRLLSRRMMPDQHPVKTDSVVGLVVSGVVSAYRFPHLRLTKRFGIAAAFLLLGATPRFLLRYYFSAITSAQKRNKAAPAQRLDDRSIPAPVR